MNKKSLHISENWQEAYSLAKGFLSDIYFLDPDKSRKRSRTIIKECLKKRAGMGERITRMDGNQLKTNFHFQENEYTKTLTDNAKEDFLAFEAAQELISELSEKEISLPEPLKDFALFFTQRAGKPPRKHRKIDMISRDEFLAFTVLFLKGRAFFPVTRNEASESVLKASICDIVAEASAETYGTIKKVWDKSQVKAMQRPANSSPPFP